MANELRKDDMRRFARLRAIRRLEDIRKEEAVIRASFPELFAGTRPAAAPRFGSPRKRSAMAPALRKAVSGRMTKYWAGRRKGKNG